MSDNLPSNPMTRVKVCCSILIAKEPAQHGKPLLRAGTHSTAHFAFPGTSVHLPLGYHCGRNTFKSSLSPKLLLWLHGRGESKKVTTPEWGLWNLHTLGQRSGECFSSRDYSTGGLHNVLLLPTAQPQIHWSPEVELCWRSFRKLPKNVSLCLFCLLSTPREEIPTRELRDI